MISTQDFDTAISSIYEDMRADGVPAPAIERAKDFEPLIRDTVTSFTDAELKLFGEDAKDTKVVVGTTMAVLFGALTGNL